MNDSTPRLCGCGCGLPVRNHYRRGHNKRPFGAISDPDRFWRLVQKTDDCWEWGGMIRNGYGRFQLTGHTLVTAHRYAYELATGGRIPDHLEIDHLCRNRACVRPDHLEAVSHSVNVLRCDHHQRRKTHCPQGHPYDAQNTYTDKRGKRYCKTCLRYRAVK